MPSLRINEELNDEIYFITCTVNRWYYVFDRYDRWDILSDSLIHCQEHKELRVYAYVFMLNHIHLLVQSSDVSGFLRDFKKYTALELFKNIKKTEPRVADLFMRDDRFSIWQKTNMPQLIESEKFFIQKKNYIEENPVRKNYVLSPEHWVHSSANPRTPIVIESL